MNDPPPRSAICGQTMFASQKLLRTLAPMTRSYTSSDAPAAGPRYGLTAALLTMMSMPPHSAVVWSTSFCSSSLRAIWQGITAASPPLARMPAATASHTSALRLEITTLAPCSAMRSAMARPIPLLEPVTTATLPVRSNSDDIRASFAGGYRSVCSPLGNVNRARHANETNIRLSPRRPDAPAASGQRRGDRRLDPRRLVRRARAGQPPALWRPCLSGERALRADRRTALLSRMSRRCRRCRTAPWSPLRARRSRRSCWNARRAGVGGVIIFASGYAETGKQDRIAQQQRLAAIARESGMRIVGPNCIGVVNAPLDMRVTFMDITPIPPPRRHADRHGEPVRRAWDGAGAGGGARHVVQPRADLGQFLRCRHG